MTERLSVLQLKASISLSHVYENLLQNKFCYSSLRLNDFCQSQADGVGLCLVGDKLFSGRQVTIEVSGFRIVR